MIGHGTNRKSMAYVGNIAAFLDHAIHSDCKYGVFNYVDGPDYDMKTLVRDVRDILHGSSRPPLGIPFGLGLAIGYLADGISRLTGRSLPISALRVRKFCATTSYATSKKDLNCFTAPFAIEEAVRRTVLAEFLSPDPAREIFFTE